MKRTFITAAMIATIVAFTPSPAHSEERCAPFETQVGRAGCMEALKRAAPTERLELVSDTAALAVVYFTYCNVANARSNARINELVRESDPVQALERTKRYEAGLLNGMRNGYFGCTWYGNMMQKQNKALRGERQNQ